ncbi:MAG: hypothetical protein ABI883_02035 [Chthoniobacterales bacterium]
MKTKSGGCGCCAGGCLSMGVIALVLLVLFVGGAWFFYGKTVNAFTSDQPTMVQMAAPTEAEFAPANAKVDQLRNAVRARESATVAFSGDEINALIARHPSFSDLRGKARVAIANSILDVEMSVPLRDLPLPRMKHRWFNGSARFGLIYDEDRFSLAVKSLRANGRDIDLSSFQSMADKLNDKFNEGFEKAQRNDGDSKEFWENVKSVRVLEDHLIITTKGDENEEAEPAEPTSI